MTTLESEQKDILKKLNEIALEANWGTTERVNGVPKAVAVIQEAMEKIKRLREQNDELNILNKKKAENLTLFEWVKIVNTLGGEIKAIDLGDNNEQIRKDTAKEILQDLKDRSIWFIVGTAQFVQDHFWEQFDEMCQSYGVEINKNE